MNGSKYDSASVQPMRDELTRLGFEELLTPDSVDALLSDSDESVLLVVNSVCGCAAGSARPAVKLALEHNNRPNRLATVFAGMEMEAVERARSYFHGYPPSSPQIALLKEGRVQHMLQRRDIEGRSAEQISSDLTAAFDQHCPAD